MKNKIDNIETVYRVEVDSKRVEYLRR